jgi:hypothetical protein
MPPDRSPLTFAVQFNPLTIMKIILPLVAAALLLAPSLLVIGCSSLTTRRADRTWESVGLPDGPDTARKVDKDGNPSFGPK